MQKLPCPDTCRTKAHLRESVLVCGCGGLGGVLINLLARAGVGTLRLVDGGIFVPSNLNRQWFSDTLEISRVKSEVTGARVRVINPLIEVEGFPLSWTRIMRILCQGMDLVIDALDDLLAICSGGNCKRMRVPFIYSAASGWWGRSAPSLRSPFWICHSIYGREEEQDQPDNVMGVLGPAPAVIGGLAAFEAIRLLSGRNPAYADQLLYLDGESGRMDVIYLE